MTEKILPLKAKQKEERKERWCKKRREALTVIVNSEKEWHLENLFIRVV